MEAVIDLKEAIGKLADDANYYGDYGKQFLSNSDIGTLIIIQPDILSQEKIV